MAGALARVHVVGCRLSVFGKPHVLCPTSHAEEPIEMNFDTRDLKPYAEPVAASSLAEGREYFSVQYADEDMLIPVIETWVYLGKDLEKAGDQLLYFQDIESYRQGVRYNSAGSDRAVFQVAEPGKANHIFQFDHALDELMKCSVRRNSRGS